MGETGVKFGHGGWLRDRETQGTPKSRGRSFTAVNMALSQFLGLLEEIAASPAFAGKLSQQEMEWKHAQQPHIESAIAGMAYGP